MALALVSAQPFSAASPQVHVAPAVARLGSTVTITGADFPDNQSFQVAVCGNNGTDGSPDCDLEGAGLGAPSGQGRFVVSLVIAQPPVPCPCVIAVTGPSLPAPIDTPIVIPDARTSPTTSRPARGVAPALHVDSASIHVRWSVAEMFGGAGRRVLALQLTNEGDGPAESPPAMITRSGAGGLATINAADLGVIGEGQTRTYHIPFRLDALAFGTTHVRGTIGNAGTTAEFETSTTTFPWGLTVIALLLLQAFLLLIRNRVRRRIQSRVVAQDSNIIEAEPVETR